MHVLIVPDKFKGTLSAAAAAAALARGWREVRPNDTLECLPMSDGGDGFGCILSTLLNADDQSVATVNAAHRPCEATWGWDAAGRTAIIESARVIGLARLPDGQFHPFDLDTFGLGAVLDAARSQGATRYVMGIGGSATNDGGFGVARALGWRFLDSRGGIIEKWTGLHALQTVVPPDVPFGFESFIVAVDVQNRLLGTEGCSRIYGPQKGLRPEDFDLAERCLSRLAEVVEGGQGRDIAAEPGSGAAGGLGFGLMAFLGARLEPGFALFAETAQLAGRLASAQLVITAEGAIDQSSLMGKGVGEVARLCEQRRIPCVGIGGMVSNSARTSGLFQKLYALAPDLTAEVSAKEQPERWLVQAAARAASAEWGPTINEVGAPGRQSPTRPGSVG